MTKKEKAERGSGAETGHMSAAFIKITANQGNQRSGLKADAGFRRLRC